MVHTSCRCDRKYVHDLRDIAASANRFSAELVLHTSRPDAKATNPGPFEACWLIISAFPVHDLAGSGMQSQA